MIDIAERLRRRLAWWKSDCEDLREAADEIRFNSGLDLSEDVCSELAKPAVDAAYAAQFKSDDYAELIEELREDALQFDLKDTAYENTAKEAADALEALLAERDDFAEQIALRSENGISKDLQEFLRKFKEDDSAAIRMFAQYRDLEIEMDSWKSLWEKTNAHMRQVEAERDALAARLAPVEDEALVEIVGRTLRAEVFDPDVLKVYGDLWAYDEQRKILKQARAALAAIRPHIESAERERCAKIVELDCDRHSTYAIAAAIRSGK